MTPEEKRAIALQAATTSVPGFIGFCMVESKLQPGRYDVDMQQLSNLTIAFGHNFANTLEAYEQHMQQKGGSW